ncbi:hypothetical protein CC78DRAFT_513611 [Lojkania enalia]|uniref:HD domain-containing protein n=1 Tax=Lojkania enalia TaxID=147567 RepID=A0A9P4N1V4_9PLEO|nr:hypothetical protein CC78DRAFT_513611 [Didymosphaeria enalia]
MALQRGTRVLAGVTVPDTPLINKALAYAREYMDDQGYKHVVRSWLTGQAIIAHLPSSAQQSIDVELFAISTILHDLGWSTSPDVTSADKCFEVDGANAARDFIIREAPASEWDKHRIQLLWDAIALHTNPLIAAHKEQEVLLAHAGISTELLGIEVNQKMLGKDLIGITPDEFNGIVKEFPKDGLKGYIIDVMCGLCKRKPETTYMSFVGGFGEKYLEGYSCKGKQVVDLMEAFLSD